MNGHRKTPDERSVLDLTPADWAVVTRMRTFIYDRLRVFGERKLKRRVFWKGSIGQHQWVVLPPDRAYGTDPVSLMEDLEYRALEAAATAAHEYKPSEGITLESFMSMRIDSKLQSEFGSMTSVPEEVEGLVSLDDVGEDEMSYLDEHDRPDGPDDGLDEVTREKLQAAMGALTSREAWALRMKADGLPNDVIAANLGLTGEKSVYKIIAEARRKAQGAYDDA